MHVSSDLRCEAGIRTLTVAAQRRIFTGLPPVKPGHDSQAFAFSDEILPGPYWQASHSSPLRIASMEQAIFSSGVKVCFFTLTVAFSMLDAPSVRR